MRDEHGTNGDKKKIEGNNRTFNQTLLFGFEYLIQMQNVRNVERSRSYIVNFDFNFYGRGLPRTDNKIWRDRPAAAYIIFHARRAYLHNNVVIIFGKPSSNEFRDRRGVYTACCGQREERVCFRHALNSPTGSWRVLFVRVLHLRTVCHGSYARYTEARIYINYRIYYYIQYVKKIV